MNEKELEAQRAAEKRELEEKREAEKEVTNPHTFFP
jgi:hypothetical protein